MSTAEQPVFIGGLAHSGKTPVRVVLAKHPDIALTRKSYLWIKYYNRWGDLDDPRARTSAVDAVLADRAVHALTDDTARVRGEFAEGPFSYARLFGIIHRHHAEREGKPRWGEQLGLVEAFAEPIFATFPDARIVHMIRDPRDRVGAPRFSRRGRAGWETAKWLYSARLARENERRHRGRYRVAHYEQLVDDPAATIRDICDFLGLAVTDPMLASLGTISRDESRPPIEPRRQSFVESHTGEALTDLGYASCRSTRRSGLPASVQSPIDQLGTVAWRATRQRSLAKQTGARL